jgi:peptidoglycan/LPS O-acetylase OafA/YrhL
MTIQHKHFRKIDFLRGIAILTVFQAHFLWYYFPAYAGLVSVDAGHPAKKVGLLNVLPRTIGWGGVTIFILVSGFLLHLGYLRDRGPFTLRGFYSRRFWRVYPPYLLVLVVFSLFLEEHLFASREGWAIFGLHVLSLHNLFNWSFFSVNPTFWCLALEVQLYIFYALLLYGRKRWGIKAMLGFTLGIAVVWQVIGDRLGRAGSPPWVNSVFALWVVWTAGAFLAEAWSNGQRVLRALTPRERWIVLGALVLAGVLAPLNAFLQYIAGVIGVLLMDAFLHAEKITLQGRLARLIITIGLCSFSIFLIHQPLLQAGIHFLDLQSPHYPGYRLVDGGIITLLIFGLSYAMYHFVELPSIRIGSRLRAAKKLLA